MKLRIIHSLDELKTQAALWNGLWQASDLHLPTQRFQLLELYLKQFHSDDKFAALVVEETSDRNEVRWIAALPLVLKKKFAHTVAILPNNPWMNCGDLLVDCECDVAKSIELVVDGLNDLPCAFAALDLFDADRECWQVFKQELLLRNLSFAAKERYRVGTIRIKSSSAEFHKSLSKNRRKQIKRSLRTLEALGPVTVKRFSSAELVGLENTTALQELVRSVFEIENLSWKRAAGSSIESSGLRDFFEEAISRTAEVGLFELWMLYVGEKPIAFDLGYRSKNVYCSHKISFDAAYQDHGPGQLLDYLVLESMADEPGYDWIDTCGELTTSIKKWTSGSYSRGQIILAKQRWHSRLAIHLLKFGRWLKNRSQHKSTRSTAERKVQNEALVKS